MALDVPQFDAPIDAVDPVSGPVRVVVVVDRYPPWINAGAEWMLHSILRRLVENGHDCRVASYIPEHVLASESFPFDVDGVKVYPADQAEELAADADVMICHLLWTRIGIEIATRHKLPVMYLVHNAAQISHWALTPNNVTMVVWNSHWLRAASERWPGPSFVCRPPVFCDDYAVTSDDRRECVTLVNLIPEKGVETFYDIARRRHRDKFLAVTGAYGHQHRPNHLTTNVELLQPTANMRDDVYARTRVLLVPSWVESWGRVAVEGMAAGCPVIAHPTEGLVEACGTAVQFVDARDFDGWAKAVEGLDKPKVWREWQARGRNRAKLLEGITDRDLVQFERMVRACATLAPGR